MQTLEDDPSTGLTVPTSKGTFNPDEGLRRAISIEEADRFADLSDFELPETEEELETLAQSFQQVDLTEDIDSFPEAVQHPLT